MLLLLALLWAPAASSAAPAPTIDPNTTECSVPITSISPWAMGQCGLRTSADPRVFGPEAWRTFHRFAQNFPEDPNDEAYEACVNFVNAIPYMLPCAHCGYDFGLFIRASVAHEGTYSAECAASEEYGMPCQGPVTACASGESLINFFLRAHHNVDTHTKPCKPMWSQQQAQEAFAQEQMCATGVVWGTYEVCKGQNETECVPLQFGGL